MAHVPNPRDIQQHRRAHVVTAVRLPPDPDAVVLTDDDIYEMLHYAEGRGLGATFFVPEFFGPGMLPRPDVHDIHLANGFGFSCVKHLVRDDGTEADPAPGGCMCGKWIFHAYGCADIFKEYNVICGATVTSRNAITVKACGGTQENTHRAKTRVLGPCGEKGCTWWGDRQANIQNMVDILTNDFHAERVWP